jgi:hypothetical protein
MFGKRDKMEIYKKSGEKNNGERTMINGMILYRHLLFLFLPFVLLTCNKQEGNQSHSQETITEVVEVIQNSETVPQPEITADIPEPRQNVPQKTIPEVAEMTKAAEIAEIKPNIEKRGQMEVDDKLVEYVYITNSSGNEIERDTITWRKQTHTLY